MWVSLTVHERWSGIVPMAALIAVIGAASARATLTSLMRGSAALALIFPTLVSPVLLSFPALLR